MQFGKLLFSPEESHFDRVAVPVKERLQELSLPGVQVATIDDSLADTATFCAHYEIGLDVSANCVVLEARRGEKVWYAACMVLATTRADVNGIVRRHLDARKISFAPMDTATSLTGMQYGGITPIGLPSDWPILVDARVDGTDHIVIGSGLRSSKLLVPGNLLASLPHATVLNLVKE